MTRRAIARGWRGKGALVGERIGGELIGATVSEVEPGNKPWPYHTHYLSEEWVIVHRTDSSIRVLMLSSMTRGEMIEYLDTGKLLAKGVDDEDIVFARPRPTADYWEGEK